MRLAHRLHAYDFPDMERKKQSEPIPKLGGVAVALSICVAAIAALFYMQLSDLLFPVAGILLPSLGAAMLGYVDDRQHLNPYVRLLTQAALAIAVWAAGTRIVLFGNEFLDLLALVLWIVSVVNGMNLIDNSDGLAGSTGFVASLGAGLIALLSGQELVSIMAFALAGTSLGFLWKNWFPARVYLGDAGAYFLGFLLAVLVVELAPAASTSIESAVIALLLLSLPLLDMSYVVFNRIRLGIHPFTAGRDHLSHRLQSRGISIPWSVAILQLVSIVGVGLAVLIVLY